MIPNYFKLAFRLMTRNPFFTFINITGLSIGFAVFFVLWQYSQRELKSDQFHKDYERIFRLYAEWYYDPGAGFVHYQSGSFSPAFALLAKDKFPDIESTTRIFNQSNFDEIRKVTPAKIIFSFVDKGNEKHSFIETKTAYADPNLFEFFSILLLKGQPHQVLANADAIVLSASTSKRYFGNEDPVGKTLLLNDSLSFTVTGVFQDLPKNSHLNFEILLSSRKIRSGIENITSFSRASQVYFKVKNGSAIASLENQLNQEQKELWPWDKWWGPETVTFTLFLQPLKEVPFSVFDNDVFAPKSKYLLNTFAIVAIIILAMAWINYINLNLFSQSKRLKELVARKTLGAQRLDFIWQFLIESFMVNCLSILVAVIIVQSMRYPLEVWLQFYIPHWHEIAFSNIMVLIGTTVVGILLVGLQPAFSVWRLSVYKVLALKKIPRRRINFAGVLTTIQYVSAIGMMIWLFAMTQQVDFVMRDNWGIARDGVVIVDLPAYKGVNFSSELNSLKNSIMPISGVEDVTSCASLPGDGSENRLHFNLIDVSGRGRTPKTDGCVDERFIPFFGIKLLAGRNFMADNPADRHAVIMSREAVESVGLEPEEAIGRLVTVEIYESKQLEKAKIVGVIDDYRHKPLYLESGFSKGNLGFILTYDNYLRPQFVQTKIAIKINHGKTAEVINKIEKQFHAIFPGRLFRWYFLNDQMNAHYKNEFVARNQILFFTGMAIGIACLGLLGMMSNKVVEKTKEIGVRKVLGASLRQITQILLSTTFKQITGAVVIGIPLAYYVVRQYFDKFSQHIALQWWHYVFPVLILVLIMLATVAIVVRKAARSNPVEALKYE